MNAPLGSVNAIEIPEADVPILKPAVGLMHESMRHCLIRTNLHTDLSFLTMLIVGRHCE